MALKNALCALTTTFLPRKQDIAIGTGLQKIIPKPF